MEKYYNFFFWAKYTNTHKFVIVAVTAAPICFTSVLLLIYYLISWAFLGIAQPVTLFVHEKKWFYPKLILMMLSMKYIEIAAYKRRQQSREKRKTHWQPAKNRAAHKSQTRRKITVQQNCQIETIIISPIGTKRSKKWHRAI